MIFVPAKINTPVKKRQEEGSFVLRNVSVIAIMPKLKRNLINMSSTQKLVAAILVGTVAIGAIYLSSRDNDSEKKSEKSQVTAEAYSTEAPVVATDEKTPAAPETETKVTSPSPSKTVSTPSNPPTAMAPTPKKLAFPGILPDAQIKNKKVTIETNKGTIVIELYPVDAPKTVSNFVYLATQKFYDGLTFHRYVEGFVIQGGDPTGNGTGGPGYKFEDEKVTKSYKQGIVAMANAGPDTNGSQFFIMLEDVPLPPAYTIFGKVTSGMDVVDQLRAGDTMKMVTVSSSK
jgi:cyclophilin family peptidyl-prolyl cis-trans isomerase